MSYGLQKGSIAGFEQAIQSYAIHVLSLTYQKVPRPVLAEVCVFIYTAQNFFLCSIYSKIMVYFLDQVAGKKLVSLSNTQYVCVL